MERAALALCCAWLLLGLAAGEPSAEIHVKRRGGLSPHGVTRGALELAVHRLQTDVFEAVPRTFDPLYKTPCWHSGGGLSCLPYFYLSGVFQCGVLDLSQRLALHPDVAMAPMMHFWDEKRPFSWYEEALRPHLAKLQSSPGTAVLGDPSFSTFTFTWSSSERITSEWASAFSRCRKETCASEQKCVEERCYADARAVAHPLSGGGANVTLPWLLRSAHGANIKLLVLLRDPVERLRSAFWQYEHYQAKFGPMATGRPADEASFSAWALDAVDNYERCRLEGYSEADCCEAFEALSPRNEKVFYHMDQLLKSLHVHWLEGWLAAFPRESVLVLRLEDWKAGATNVLRDTLRAVIGHLDLAPASEALLDQMVALPVRRFGGDRKPPTGKGVMEPATLQRLRTFFAPFNHRLASLLGDDKWRWGY